MSETTPLTFSSLGPFDEEERGVIGLVFAALGRSGNDRDNALRKRVADAIGQLDRLGVLLDSYPAMGRAQSLGRRTRDIDSLVDMFVRVNPSNLEMYLPTRALVARTLVLGEVNFYRLLRFVCVEALPEDDLKDLKPLVERHLCHCLHTRLAEILFMSIASDTTVERETRSRAVVALVTMWEQATYRVNEFFPVLEATWDARRLVPATLGTLMGTAEMFRLIEAGCDERFVDYLVRDDHTENEEAAFREFLFGATTEQLRQIEEQMRRQGKRAIGRDEVESASRLSDACSSDGDPALALFDFFLSRHLQATARRDADSPGPKRTAEEYVMLHYLRA
jgi:hypothetical protein